MTDYLSYKFEDSEEFISTFDELPLWSASFGLLLFKHLVLKPNLTVVDIGSGAGFPLLELAGRLGSSCKLYGIDPWKNANARSKQKIKNYGYSNVEIIESSAEQIPFPGNSVDLVVSNLGINNFEQPQSVFTECYRILKPGGKLVLTTNLDGHWKTFYTVFEDTLRQLNKKEYIEKLVEQQTNRGTIKSITGLFTDSGIKVSRYFEEKFEMKFLNGSAFLNHHFVKLGWLSSWLEIFPDNERAEIFHLLQENLNSFSEKSNGLSLSVPMAFIEGVK